MGKEQVRGSTADNIVPVFPCPDKHRDIPAHRVTGIEECFHPVYRKTGNLFHFFLVMDNDPLYRLPVTPGGSIPGYIQ